MWEKGNISFHGMCHVGGPAFKFSNFNTEILKDFSIFNFWGNCGKK